jgi:hypothetical protein
LYIPTRTSSLMKAWSFPAFCTTSSGILACLVPLLMELLCARSADSALSYMTIIISSETFSLWIADVGSSNFRQSIKFGAQQQTALFQINYRGANSLTNGRLTQILLAAKISWSPNGELLKNSLKKAFGCCPYTMQRKSFPDSEYF